MAEPWIEEALTALGTLRGRTARQKRDTILAVVTAKMRGDTVNSVLTSDNSPVSEQGYYRWMKDAEFRKALERVESLAMASQDRESLDRIRRAKRMIAQAAPAAVRELTKILLTSPDERIRLQAANSILDRARLDLVNNDASASDTARGATINSDTMAALIQDALANRGKMIE